MVTSNIVELKFSSLSFHPSRKTNFEVLYIVLVRVWKAADVPTAVAGTRSLYSSSKWRRRDKHQWCWWRSEEEDEKGRRSSWHTVHVHLHALLHGSWGLGQGNKGHSSDSKQYCPQSDQKQHHHAIYLACPHILIETIAGVSSHTRHLRGVWPCIERQTHGGECWGQHQQQEMCVGTLFRSSEHVYTLGYSLWLYMTMYLE